MADLAPGTEEANGKVYMRNAQGDLRPIELVKVADRLEDETVRELFAQAEATALILQAFKLKTFDEVDAFAAQPCGDEVDQQVQRQPRAEPGEHADQHLARQQDAQRLGQADTHAGLRPRR